jgi:tungstate transport system substrate-binding protein
MRTKKYAIPIIILLLIFAVGILAGCGAKPAQQTTPSPAVKDLILATTTSTQDSGLLDVLKPIFEQKTGYNLKIISVGSGAALEMGNKGEADVLLVHSPAAEKALVDSGVGINYQLVMHNDFIVVGPTGDPAAIKGSTSIDAFKKIAAQKATFVSRGDKSGTNTKEVGIWKTAGITPEGSWYLISGTGMGATLNIANEKQGYTLADRATYLAQKANFKLDILSEGDKDLLNIYHVMQVNPEKFSKVNKDGAKAFVDFMISPETQKTIEDFGKDKYGQSLFIPDAGKAEADLGK